MRRMTREAIRMRIAIALTLHKPAVKRAVGMNTEDARERVTADLVERIMCPPESEAVILVPDLYGSVHSPYHGKWDIDEPHPHPDLPWSTR